MQVVKRFFMNHKTVDIVTVDYNTGPMLRSCLESIARYLPQESALGRVVVVDNASTAASASYLPHVDLPLTLIRNRRNCGFAAACNQGAVGSAADYLLFLNADTMLHSNSLDAPIQFMEHTENASVGICGIQLVDSRNTVNRTCARFPTPRMFISRMLGFDRLLPACFPPHFMEEWDHLATRQVDQVMGAFFLVRRPLFEALGGFDERFFMYFEEVDFALRARQVGWSTYYIAEAQAYHKGGGASEQVKASRLYYSLRSRILYGYKHFGWLSAAALALATLFIEPVARSVLALKRGTRRDLHELWRGFFWLWADAVHLFRGTVLEDAATAT